MLRKIYRNLIYIPSIIRREHGIYNTARKTCRVLFYEGLNGVSLRLRTFKSQKEVKPAQSVPEKKKRKKNSHRSVKVLPKLFGKPPFLFTLENSRPIIKLGRFGFLRKKKYS